MTARANVFRVVARNFHLCAAIAKGRAGEKLDGTTGGFLSARSTLVEDGVDLLPYLNIDNRLDRHLNPLGLRFEHPFLPVTEALRVIGPANSLCRCIAKQSVNGGKCELRTVSRSVARLIESF